MKAENEGTKESLDDKGQSATFSSAPSLPHSTDSWEVAFVADKCEEGAEPRQ